jgi:hypothetical protein
VSWAAWDGERDAMSEEKMSVERGFYQRVRERFSSRTNMCCSAYLFRYSGNPNNSQITVGHCFLTPCLKQCRKPSISLSP